MLQPAAANAGMVFVLYMGDKRLRMVSTAPSQGSVKRLTAIQSRTWARSVCAVNEEHKLVVKADPAL